MKSPSVWSAKKAKEEWIIRRSGQVKTLSPRAGDKAHFIGKTYLHFQGGASPQKLLDVRKAFGFTSRLLAALSDTLHGEININTNLWGSVTDR